MPRHISRRAFLLRSALASPLPYMLTRAALGAQGIAPPSDRLLMGHIGVGGMGGGHLGAMVNRTDASVVAVCDVDQDRLASARHAARD